MVSNKDFKAIAEWVKAEADSRRGRRLDLEKKWDEVDRQIAMIPREKPPDSGSREDWYPALEEPLQYNALEVTLADLQAMLFPKGAEWYSPVSYLSDEYLERFEERRREFPLITKEPVVDPETGLPIVEAIDQDGADALVKATLDYYHRLYSFRSKMNLFCVEVIKYGIGVTRVREVDLAMYQEYRGNHRIIGPALAPASIRNTYPDPSEHFLLHEGFQTRPTTISCGMQLLDDMKRAARAGGTEKGWRTGIVSRLEALRSQGHDRRGHVEKIEAEGDLIVPRSGGSIFLPNVHVTVAVSARGADVVRLRHNTLPVGSYVFQNYLQDSLQTPYGGSPLIKNQPVQDSAALALNDLLACGHYNAKPTIAYDRNDPKLAGQGGPEIYPGAMIPADNPDLIRELKVGDPAALLQSYLALLKKSEDLTATNDPRRGQGLKSHTGTGAHELDVIRGVARTQDVADDMADGALTTILNLEYYIAKRNLDRTPIPVDSQGIEGWVRIHRDDLPDEAMFRVHGASGAAMERERSNNFLAASQFALQIQAAAIQMGQQIDIDHVALIAEVFQNAGVQNVARFVRAAQAAPAGPPQPPELSGAEGASPGLGPALAGVA